MLMEQKRMYTVPQSRVIKLVSKQLIAASAGAGINSMGGSEDLGDFFGAGITPMGGSENL